MACLHSCTEDTDPTCQKEAKFKKVLIFLSLPWHKSFWKDDLGSQERKSVAEVISEKMTEKSLKLDKRHEGTDSRSIYESQVQ